MALSSARPITTLALGGLYPYGFYRTQLRLHSWHLTDARRLRDTLRKFPMYGSTEWDGRVEGLKPEDVEPWEEELRK